MMASSDSDQESVQDLLTLTASPAKKKLKGSKPSYLRDDCLRQDGARHPNVSRGRQPRRATANRRARSAEATGRKKKPTLVDMVHNSSDSDDSNDPLRDPDFTSKLIERIQSKLLQNKHKDNDHTYNHNYLKDLLEDVSDKRDILIKKARCVDFAVGRTGHSTLSLFTSKAIAVTVSKKLSKAHVSVPDSIHSSCRLSIHRPF